MIRERLPILSIFALRALFAAPGGHAFHPISSKLEFITSYPKHPKVNYGSGAQAEIIRRGEYLAQLGDCLACHSAQAV